LSKQNHFLKLSSPKYKLFGLRPNFTTSHIYVYVTSNNAGRPRIGIKVTKKAVSLAVVRNLIRRRISANFLEQKFNFSNDVIIVISKKIFSEKKEISDILMQEWKQSVQYLRKSY